AVGGRRGDRSAVLLLRVRLAAEQFLQDFCERLRIEEGEALARDAADDDVIAFAGGLPRAEYVGALGEHGFAHRGPPQRFGVVFVQGYVLEQWIGGGGAEDRR